MKTRFIITQATLAGVAAFSVGFSSVLLAQTSSTNAVPEVTQDSKVPDSTADKHSASTGSSADQTSTLDKTNSKDTTNSLDKNPSTASTDSADMSGTKPSTSTSEDQVKNREVQETDKTSDRAFLLKAAQGGMTEVELGKIAQEKATAPEVKQFGSHMVMDHSKANDELKAIAAEKGVTVPSSLDAKHQAMVDHFNHLSGPEFDHAYVQAMVKDHEKDAAEFREASTSAQDPDVKNFASSTLKVIENHLSDIKSIQSNLK